LKTIRAVGCLAAEIAILQIDMSMEKYPTTQGMTKTVDAALFWIMKGTKERASRTCALGCLTAEVEMLQKDRVAHPGVTVKQP